MNNLKVTSKKRVLVLGLFLLIGIFAVNFVLAEDSTLSVSYCAEKTIGGAWCQNVPADQADSNYRSIPSSCESSSFCEKGYCYDSQEGTCLKNTPQRVCQDNGGVWEKDSGETPAQCQLGCCVLGDQASFVTQVRCKRLSALYGLETDYRTDFSSEAQCIFSVTSQAKGACVFEEDFEKTCRFTTKEECIDMGASFTPGNNTNAEVSFYEDRLCSDETLGTNCGPTEDTKCVDGKDQVYFVDSCGNLANVYDASKMKDKNYWSEIYDVTESCGYGQGNADSKECGNCDYFAGSTCREYDSGEDKARPTYGNNICRNLACEYEGEEYQHGETWCAESAGTDESLPGSRHFRLICYDGEVSIEPCADFRQEVCLQSEVNDFRNAACRVNMWQDCYAQENQEDCENTDRRDCQWMPDIELNNPQVGGVGSGGDIFAGTDQGEPTDVFAGTDNEANVQSGITGNAIFGDDDEEDEWEADGACVPLNAPGFDFWQAEGQAQGLCSQATVECIVTYEKKVGGDPTCKDNCQCLEDSWADQMNKACVAIGDCGGSTNYIGVQGYHDGSSISTEDYEPEGEDDEGGGLFG